MDELLHGVGTNEAVLNTMLVKLRNLSTMRTEYICVLFIIKCFNVSFLRTRCDKIVIAGTVKLIFIKPLVI